jgi:PAS domain S-box-containing protein
MIREAFEPNSGAGSHADGASTDEMRGGALIGVTAEGVISAWSGNAEKLYGYGAAEMVGKPISDLIPPNYPDEISAPVRRTARGECMHVLEGRLLTKSHEVRNVSICVSPVKDASGRLIEASALVREVRENAELQQQQDEISCDAEVLDLIHDAIVVRDASGVIVHWNKGAESLYGFSSEEAIGKHFGELLQTDGVLSRIDDMEAALHNHKTCCGERSYIGKDGRRLVVSSRCLARVDAGGALNSVIEIDTDITAIKELEAIRADGALVVDSSGAGFITTDITGRIHSWNAGAETIFGFPADEIIGRDHYCLVPANSTTNLAEIIQRVIQLGTVERFEDKRVCRDGSIIDTTQTLSPIHDFAGAVKGISIIVQDITERKRAAESLRDTKEFLQTLWEHAPDAMFLLDSNCRISSFSRRAQDMFGYSPDEFSDLPFEDLVARKITSTQLLQCLQDRTVHAVGTGKQLYGKRKNGSEFPVDIMVSPIKSKHGQILMAVVRDVTEQKELEAARKEAQDRLRAQDMHFMSSTPDPLLVARAQKSSEAIFGAMAVYASVLTVACLLNIHELRNPTPWGSMTSFHGAASLDAIAVAAVFASMTSKIFRQASFVLGFLVAVLAILALSEVLLGSHFGVTWFVSQWNPNKVDVVRMSLDSVAAFTCLGISLMAGSSSKPKISQLCAVLAFSIGMLSLTDYTYNMGTRLALDPNKQMAFPVCIGVVGLSIALFLREPSRGFARVLVSPRMGGKLMRKLLPLILVIPSLGLLGSLGDRSQITDLIIGLTSMMIPVAIWWVSQTIDQLDLQRDDALKRAFERREELEELNKVLEKAKDEALQASNLKSAFIASISHELRTPLSGILGNIELLHSGGGLREEQMQELATAHACAHSLLLIVNDLLDLSRIEVGKLSIEQVLFSPIDLINEVSRTLAPAINAKGLEFKTSVEPQVPNRVVGDPGRIRQVLLNLINNAVKFTHQGFVSLEAGLEVGTQPEICSIKFEIHDTGIGIASADQTLLFQPFSQVDSSLTRAFGGAGLGLALCKNLVELMGGNLGVESEKGHGSVFWFTVPFTIQRSAEPVAQPTPIVSLPIALEGKVVLVVEDSPVVQKIVRKQLSSLGLQSLGVVTGQEAIETIAAGHFDLILMDFNLPDMTGLDVTRAIRNMQAKSGVEHVPIIAMTAAAMKGDKEMCLESGMDDYLSKPVTIRQLREKLEHWLTSHPDGAD